MGEEGGEGDTPPLRLKAGLPKLNPSSIDGYTIITHTHTEDVVISVILVASMALALSLFPDLDPCLRLRLLKVRKYEADMNYSNNYTIRDKLFSPA